MVSICVAQRADQFSLSSVFGEKRGCGPETRLIMGARHSQSSADRPPPINDGKSKIPVVLFDEPVTLRIQLVVMNGRTETGKTCLCERLSGQGWTQSCVNAVCFFKAIEVDDIRMQLGVQEIVGDERWSPPLISRDFGELNFINTLMNTIPSPCLPCDTTDSNLRIVYVESPKVCRIKLIV